MPVRVGPSSLLLGKAHSHIDEVDRPAAPAVPLAIARAVDLLGKPPITYLRDLRLRGIH
jgi:hypothetical protein